MRYCVAYLSLSLLGAMLALPWTMVAMPFPADPITPAELVRRAVKNETKAPDADAKFMFRVYKKTPNGSQTKLFVQTREAMAGIVIANNDQPLTEEQRKGEMWRVNRFINDPDELKKKQKQEKDDAERATRIIRALPDAFLYEEDGTETGRQGIGKPGSELIRLKFSPNPKYDPPTRVEQILTGMQGFVLIDATVNRIAKIDGTLVKDVGFGWGILGHLDHGGHATIEQGDIGGGYWRFSTIQVSVTGKVLLFKGINYQSTEVYSDYQKVPSDLSFAQGIDLLKKREDAILQKDSKVASTK